MGKEDPAGLGEWAGKLALDSVQCIRGCEEVASEMRRCFLPMCGSTRIFSVILKNSNNFKKGNRCMDVCLL